MLNARDIAGFHISGGAFQDSFFSSSTDGPFPFRINGKFRKELQSDFSALRIGEDCLIDQPFPVLELNVWCVRANLVVYPELRAVCKKNVIHAARYVYGIDNLSLSQSLRSCDIIVEPFGFLREILRFRHRCKCLRTGDD